jgi:hypothetical protein
LHLKKLNTLGTKDTGKVKVREYRSGKKRVIERNWQHSVHKKQNKKMLENIEGAIKKDIPEKLAT